VNTPSPYAVLGVDSSADADAVKRAYRQLIRQWHPDVNDDPQAVVRTAELNAAYEVLADREQRAAYDAGGIDLASLIERWLHRQETCLHCGRDLLAPLGDVRDHRFSYRRRRDALYCSNACRQAAYRERKRQERERRSRLREGRDQLDGSREP
jgi:DnaJ-class molecular chaperone